MGSRPKKRFGQNFLYDPAIAEKILAATRLSPRQTVVELGAGKGILTRPLARLGVRLIALEIDSALCRELTGWLENAADVGGRVEVLNLDFTQTTITELLAARGLESCVLIGNIPYHLTRDVLFSFLVDEVEMLESAYLMVQREVGERVVSPPGSRVYGITSVILQSLYAVRLLFRVSPGSFHPVPRVESAVLEFKPLAEPLVAPGDLGKFCRLVKNVFQQRRKTLHSTVRLFYSLSENELRDVAQRAEIDLRRRPEALSKEEFLRLFRAVAQVASVGQTEGRGA
jgi:16S rRNA (adenine1518-N6/adenine1519-N6)-dimethyltransferase